MSVLPPTHPVCTVPGLWPAGVSRRGTVALFRQAFTVTTSPARARVVITASHRYALRLDGVTIARGPSRSDPRAWGVRTVDLGVLSPGPHVIAVRVDHDGDGAGESQMGPDGFLSIAAIDDLAPLVTVAGWRARQDRAVAACEESSWADSRRHNVVGAGETFTASAHPWGWDRVGFAGRGWSAPEELRSAADVWGNLALDVQPVDEALPPMASVPLALPCVAVGMGDAPLRVPASRGDAAVLRWAAWRGPLRVAARTKMRVVLSRGASGVHWPTVGWSGGKGAVIRVTWCEAPVGAEKRLLPDRRDVIHGQLVGHRDVIRCDGGDRRSWTPGWLRSGRYMVIDISTGATAIDLDPVRLDDAVFPFTARGGLRLSAGATWRKLLVITDRTLKSCAHECIWDCPHFEQCQFPGDARVQSIAHYLLYNDDRLARKAMRDLADAQRPDGLLPCRAPLRRAQRIDTFTVQWVLMIEEFLTFRGDVEFVRSLMPAARHAIEPFITRRRADGLIGGGLMAPFVDWSKAFTAGNAPQDANGGSAIVTLLVAQAATALARCERAAGWPELSRRWTRLAVELSAAVRATCWDAAAGIIHDTPSRTSRSVHAQVEAIHAGVLRGRGAARALAATLGQADVAQPGTRFYTWHLGRAHQRIGLDDAAMDLVGGWTRQMAKTPGIATWPESDGSPRSDCHGWGCYPVLAAASGLLGLRPAADGCAAITLRPCLGDRDAARGVVPTPHGPVKIAVTRAPREGLAVTWTSPVPATVAGKRYGPGTHHAVIR